MNNVKREPENRRCVHTEHCCVLHGCKYGEDDFCPVVLKQRRQSYLCESCNFMWKNSTLENTKLWKEIDLAFSGIERCSSISRLSGGQCVGLHGHEGNHWHYTEIGSYSVWGNGEPIDGTRATESIVPQDNPRWQEPKSKESFYDL